MINQKDFEAILADVHRRAEVLRAEVHHMKRLKEQLLNEKTRCLSQIKDVAQGNRLKFLKQHKIQLIVRVKTFDSKAPK